VPWRGGLRAAVRYRPLSCAAGGRRQSRRLLVCELSLEPAVRPARPGKYPDQPPQVL